MQINKIVGLNIKKYRLRSHLTQRELGEKIGVSESFICLLEKGKKSLPLKRIEKFAEVLKVPFPWFFRE